MKYPAFYYDSSRPVDVICMGRVAVDLYSEQIGYSLRDAATFKKYLGGCAGNIAVGTSRLGLNSMMFSCVGQDEMGAFVTKQLQQEGVNTDLLSATPNHLTGLVLLGIKPPKEFPLMFYRNDCADMQIKAEQISDTQLQQAKTLLITGTGLSTDAMRETTLAIVQRARKAETQVILDLDFRPVLWGLTNLGDGESRYRQAESVSRRYQELLPFCDLIVGTEEEICIAGGSENFAEALQTVRQLTPVPLVIKSGENGAEICFSASEARLRSRPFAVDVLNVLGAGDGFMSGLLSGLLQGASWETALTRANACGALVVTRHGCAPAIPYADELDYFIAQYDNNPDVWRSAELAQLHREQKQNSEALIKNPRGFGDGVTPVVTMQEDPFNLQMNFTVLKLKKGETYRFNPAYEFAALLMTGRVQFHYQQREVLAERYDYFSQNPIVLHCCRGEKAQVDALTDCELLLMETENDKQFACTVWDESTMLELDDRGKGLLEDTSYRIVRTVFDKRNRPESNLVVGEIITFQGRWSSYPSHVHKQPELYHYRFSEPQGYAFGEKGRQVMRVEHYDTYQIGEDEAHAHCTAPGYALYTLWVIRHLPDNPYTVPQFLPEHEWTRHPAANLRVWKKAGESQ